MNLDLFMSVGSVDLDLAARTGYLEPFRVHDKLLNSLSASQEFCRTIPFEIPAHVLRVMARSNGKNFDYYQLWTRR